LCGAEGVLPDSDPMMGNEQFCQGSVLVLGVSEMEATNAFERLSKPAESGIFTPLSARRVLFSQFCRWCANHRFETQSPETQAKETEGVAPRETEGGTAQTSVGPLPIVGVGVYQQGWVAAAVDEELQITTDGTEPTKYLSRARYPTAAGPLYLRTPIDG
jgi:hypothetical protein